MSRFKEYSDLEKSFEYDVNYICYYMKGSYNKNDVWAMTTYERKICSEFIKETVTEERKLQSRNLF